MLMFGDSNGGGGSSNNNNKQQCKISNEWCIDCYVIVSYLSCYFTRPSQTKWTDCENCLKRVWVCLWMCVCLHVCSVFGVIFFFFLQKRLTSLFLTPPSLTLLLFFVFVSPMFHRTYRAFVVVDLLYSGLSFVVHSFIIIIVRSVSFTFKFRENFVRF